MRLVLCEGCQRHVRDDGERCPFCGEGIRAPAPTGDRVGRLGRAAIMAFGVAAGSVGIDGCQKDIAQPYGAPPEKSTPTAIAMPYGAPPRELTTATPITSDAAAVAVADAATSSVTDAASSHVDAGGKAKDAGTNATSTALPAPTRNIAKPYGAPPNLDALV